MARKRLGNLFVISGEAVGARLPPQPLDPCLCIRSTSMENVITQLLRWCIKCHEIYMKGLILPPWVKFGGGARLSQRYRSHGAPKRNWVHYENAELPKGRLPSRADLCLYKDRVHCFKTIIYLHCSCTKIKEIIRVFYKVICDFF